MIQSGFHSMAAIDFKEREGVIPKRQRMTTEEGRKAYNVRHRREEIEEAFKLENELRDFG